MNIYVRIMMAALFFFLICAAAPMNGFAVDANAPAAAAPTAAASAPATTAPSPAVPTPPQAEQKAAPMANPAASQVKQTAASAVTPAASADADKLVNVEAEGQGETKILAMKAAWMEAVRLGIGMYLDAKTTAIDDAVTEEIVTHSRGRVNSYEELGSEQTANGWKVRIRANIEKDVLTETAKSVQSRTVKVNPNDIAPVITGRMEGRSAQELLAAYKLPPWKEFFTLDFQSERKDGQYVGKFSFQVNMDKYTQVFVKELGDRLSAVASHKREGRFDAKQSTLLKQILQGDARFDNWSLIFSHEQLYYGRFDDAYQIYIVVNSSYYMVYAVSEEVLNDVISKRKDWPHDSFNPKKIRLLVDAMEKGNILDSTFQKISIWDCFLAIASDSVNDGHGNYKPHKRIIIYPAYRLLDKGQAWRYKDDFTLPIKLPDDVMMRMDELKGSLEFE